MQRSEFAKEELKGEADALAVQSRWQCINSWPQRGGMSMFPLVGYLAFSSRGSGPRLCTRRCQLSTLCHPQLRFSVNTDIFQLFNPKSATTALPRLGNLPGSRWETDLGGGSLGNSCLLSVGYSGPWTWVKASVIFTDTRGRCKYNQMKAHLSKVRHWRSHRSCRGKSSTSRLWGSPGQNRQIHLDPRRIMLGFQNFWHLRLFSPWSGRFLDGLHVHLWLLPHWGHLHRCNL